MAESSMPGSAPAHVQEPKVLYVMGAGRSGSTILGVTLGNCEDFFYAGELDKWLSRSGVPQREGADRESFWSAVRDGVSGAGELFGVRARCLERSSALFRVRKWRRRRRMRGQYRLVAGELYRAVARTAGAGHIVDTSHYPLRAWEMQHVSGIDLYLVLLVRDPQSVVASFGRADVRERSFGTLTANAYLWLTHLLSTFVFLRHPPERRLFVRHEDFIAEPQVVLRQILDQLGSSTAPPDLEQLSTGYPIQGNRLIDSDVVTLASAPLSPVHRSRITALLQLPWAWAFSHLRPAVGAARVREGGSAQRQGASVS